VPKLGISISTKKTEHNNSPKKKKKKIIPIYARRKTIFIKPQIKAVDIRAEQQKFLDEIAKEEAYYSDSDDSDDSDSSSESSFDLILSNIEKKEIQYIKYKNKVQKK